MIKGNSKRTNLAIAQTHRAIAALYLAVPEFVADDVRKIIEELIAAYSEEITMYQATLEKIANEVGITHHLQLKDMSDNDGETYADVLIRIVKTYVKREGE